jgi:hypothetical protein
MDRFDRRQILASFAGLAAVVAEATARADEKKPKDEPPSANPLVGKWTYRSFRSIPDISTPFEKLELWRATLTVEESATLGAFQGRLDGEPGEGLILNGTISYGGTVAVRFQGRGDGNASKDWVYDYLGFLIPQWNNGVDQRPALVGTIVRTKSHKSGTGIAPAGSVAQWIAVKRDT